MTDCKRTIAKTERSMQTKALQERQATHPKRLILLKLLEGDDIRDFTGAFKVTPRLGVYVEPLESCHWLRFNVFVVRVPTDYTERLHFAGVLAAGSRVLSLPREATTHVSTTVRIVPRSLINRALRLCHPDYIDSELDHVREVLSSNGYEWKQSLRIANSSNKQKPHTVERRPIYFPFVKGVTDKIGFLLSRKFNIKTIFRPHTQIKRWLRSPKDKERLSGPGVYEIPCECGKSYIGETQRHVSTRVTEHIRSVKNRNTLQSAIAEHSLDSDANHYIRFDKAAVLAREKFFVPRKIREAIEISRRPNFNRDSGWFLPQSWKPVLRAALPTGLQAVKSEDIVSVVCTDWLVNDNSITQPTIQQPLPAVAHAPPMSARAQRAEARSSRRAVVTRASDLSDS
ncbi:hypothetical protein NE865_01990 [Phthorimaea operculella]|nr:hypothetical protein NE865_01990 [Phthorimaea operculella]